MLLRRAPFPVPPVGCSGRVPSTALALFAQRQKLCPIARSEAAPLLRQLPHADETATNQEKPEVSRRRPPARSQSRKPCRRPPPTSRTLYRACSRRHCENE